MMQNELIDDDALFPFREVKCTFEPELPDGCTWVLWADNEQVTEGGVGPDEKTTLQVRARCSPKCNLELHVQLPPVVGLVSNATQAEGGLVVVDCADIVDGKPKPMKKQIPFPKQRKFSC